MPMIRIITDGKAGDVTQCEGVAEAVVALAGGRVEVRVVHPRVPFVWAMPWGPPDPRDAAAIAPPFPDIAIATGRRAVASLRALKRRSPRTFTVFLKDPRTGLGAADLIWVPEHDGLRGANVVATLTSPHRITAPKLAAAEAEARSELLALPKPRVAVLIGGPSKSAKFGPGDAERLAGDLARLADSGVGLMVTPSRRTPAALLETIRGAVGAGSNVWIWDSEGANPYLEMLALCDGVVVTADSANMLGEAAMTGKTIHVFMPERLDGKLLRFVNGLERQGLVVKFAGRLETTPYEPLNSTPAIAREILRRAALSPG